MQLKDLVKPVEQMTDEELRDHVRNIRHSRTVVRAAHQKHKDKPKKKAAKEKVTKVDSMLKGMTPEQMALLLKQLEG